MSEETRTYELSYLITPTTPETEVEAVVSALKAEIEKSEGAVIAEGNPDFIDLAYTIEKNVASKKMKWSQGYFGWVKFTTAPETMEVLKKAYDANTAVMRYMLIKTDAENVVTFKKPKVEARRADLLTGEEADESLEEETNGEAPVLEVHETLPNLEAEVAETVASESVEKEA